MTLLANLQAAGLPISDAAEDGNSITWAASPTDLQLQSCRDIVLQYVDPTTYNNQQQDKTLRQQLQTDYQNTITQLEAIQNTASPTNAQVIAAVKYLAKTLELLIKILVRILT